MSDLADGLIEDDDGDEAEAGAGPALSAEPVAFTHDFISSTTG